PSPWGSPPTASGPGSPVCGPGRSRRRTRFPSERPAYDRWALQRALSTVTLFGLLIATAAAFAVTERLKLVKSPITGPRISKVFSPTCGCARGKANISLRLRHSDPVTLTVPNGRRGVVSTLATG